MKYKVEIKETLARIIDVEAENKRDAILKIKEQYRKENIANGDGLIGIFLLIEKEKFMWYIDFEIEGSEGIWGEKRR